MKNPTMLGGNRLQDNSVSARKLAEEVRLPLSKIQSIEASISTVETARDEAVAAARLAVAADTTGLAERVRKMRMDKLLGLGMF